MNSVWTEQWSIKPDHPITSIHCLALEQFYCFTKSGDLMKIKDDTDNAELVLFKAFERWIEKSTSII